jgi:hypothetical protein
MKTAPSIDLSILNGADHGPYQLPTLGQIACELPNGGGWTWTTPSILGKLLSVAEGNFGPRDKEYTILGIEFGGEVPCVWYPGNCSHVSVRLSETAARSFHCMLCELSHECIHLLAPNGGGNTNRLEEGLATNFSHRVVSSTQWRAHRPIEPTSYLSAEEDLLDLLHFYPDAIRVLRQYEPAIWRFTAELILSVFPAVDQVLAQRLCAPFDRQSLDAPLGLRSTMAAR